MTTCDICLKRYHDNYLAGTLMFQLWDIPVGDEEPDELDSRGLNVCYMCCKRLGLVEDKRINKERLQEIIRCIG